MVGVVKRLRGSTGWRIPKCNTCIEKKGHVKSENLKTGADGWYNL